MAPWNGFFMALCLTANRAVNKAAQAAGGSAARKGAPGVK
jgi:hypothetical protein